MTFADFELRTSFSSCIFDKTVGKPAASCSLK